MAKATIEEGIKYFNTRRYDLALANFENVDTDIGDSEEKMEIIYYKGLTLTKLERYDDALMFLEQVVTSNELPLRTMQCRLTLAYIYMMTKRSKMAEFELDILVKNGMESAQMYSMLAYIAWSQKDNKKAVRLYEKALDLDGGNLTAMNGLGYILVDGGIDVKRGLDLCKKAVQKKPQNPAYLDSLGWAYYKSGEISEARNALRRALELAPRQRDITRHMREVIGEAS